MQPTNQPRAIKVGLQAPFSLFLSFKKIDKKGNLPLEENNKKISIRLIKIFFGLQTNHKIRVARLARAKEKWCLLFYLIYLILGQFF
jgi:hypothetical protein